MGTRSLSPFQTTAPDSQDSPGIIAVELCGGEPVLLPSPGRQPPGRPGGARHRQPPPTAASFSEHLIKSSAAEPARLLGSSYVCVWEESSLALGPGPVTPALLVACGGPSPRGQPGPPPPGGSPAGPAAFRLGGMEKGFQHPHPLHGWAVSWVQGGRSLPGTCIPPETPAFFSCTEFRGAAPVALGAPPSARGVWFLPL